MFLRHMCVNEKLDDNTIIYAVQGLQRLTRLTQPDQCKHRHELRMHIYISIYTSSEAGASQLAVALALKGLWYKLETS